MQSQIRLQNEVNAMLRRGIIFSIFWLMGVGSLIAVIQGIKAHTDYSELERPNYRLWQSDVVFHRRRRRPLVLGIRYRHGNRKERDQVAQLRINLATKES